MTNSYISRRLSLLSQRAKASMLAYRAGASNLNDLELDLTLMSDELDSLMSRVLRLKYEERTKTGVK